MKKKSFLLLLVFAAFLLTNCSESTSSDVLLLPPTQVGISEISITEFQITWNDNSDNEDGYKLERKFDEENWVELTELSENAESYVDDISVSRQTWTTVYYKVYSFEDDDISESVVTQSPISFPAPTQLTASYTDAVYLEWTDNSNGEDGFSIERNVDNGDFSVIATVTGNDTLYTDITIEEGYLYSYKVNAYINSFYSSYSNPVDVSTITNNLQAEFSATPLLGYTPLVVTFTDISTGNYDSWSWNFGNGETSNESDPIVTFSEIGLYTITLTVSLGTSSSTEIKTEYIEVLDNSNLVLFEGFEGSFLPEGWLKISPDGGTGWETLETGTSPIPGWTGGEATACPGGGSYQAFATWSTGGSIANDQWLISPQITIQDGAVLAFWMAYYFDSYRDHVDVLISTTVQDDVNAFDVVVAEIEIPVGSPTEWTQYLYNLTDFVSAGTQVYIAFREVVADNYGDGSAISIDNIQVGSNTIRNSPVNIPKLSEVVKNLK